MKIVKIDAGDDWAAIQQEVSFIPLSAVTKAPYIGILRTCILLYCNMDFYIVVFLDDVLLCFLIIQYESGRMSLVLAS